MKQTLCILFLSIVSLHGQSSLSVVHETVPRALFLEAGGKQVNTILRGENLAELQKISIKNQGRFVNTIFTQLAPPSTTSRGVTFIASAEAALNSHYTIEAITKNGAILSIPMTLTVVPVGDGRATPPDTATLQEVTRAQSGNRIVVSEKLAPVITGTQPSPLILAPKSGVQTVYIQGRNLEGITEVRVRKFDKKPLYRGAQGLLPSRFKGGGIEVDMTVGLGTTIGSKFVLDFMVKKYLAASLSLTIGTPLEVTLLTTPSPTPLPLSNEIVIPLKPKVESSP